MTSIIKVNNLQNQCGANIISESANVITIGASGDTVTLAAGASQSGFGRSGSVNWDTTPKTTGFTAVSGNGYFCNTTSAAFTVTLPATPAAGDIVAIADYANTSATNNITVGRNGSLIDGSAIDAKIKINGQVYTLVYVDATEGWKTVGQTFNQITTVEFVAATGGCIATCGDFKIHTFTGPGTFTVTNAGNSGGSNSVDYLVIAGGGSGGTAASPRSGAGGAGGYRFSNGTASGCYSAGPAPLGSSALPVSVQGYPITVGGGGAAVPAPSPNRKGNPGTNSIFSTITSTGGGGGGGEAAFPSSVVDGEPGGSGGGSSGFTGPSPGGGSIGSGNTPPVSPSQGNNGGQGRHAVGVWAAGGGGGGAGAVGGSASPEPTPAPTASAGTGGAGLASSITTSPVTRGGGGGGSGANISSAPGGPGGGGAGSPGTGGSGTPNSGGGGGSGLTSGAGGSGIVVIRYKFQ